MKGSVRNIIHDSIKWVGIYHKKIFILFLGSWLLLTTTLVTIFVWGDPISRAIIQMGWGLIILWIFILGSIMYWFRDSIRGFVESVPLNWNIKFVLFCTFLALIEEAITTTMTNLAPYMGVGIGEAYITASTSYLDVVTMHSVVIFVPMFVAWAWLLSRYDFSPFWVFLLFGITGTLAEMSFGPQHLLEFGLWIFVYGLMVYLPAYTVPANRVMVSPIKRHYVMAIFVPLFFAIPVVLLIQLAFPGHPDIHFV